MKLSGGEKKRWYYNGRYSNSLTGKWWTGLYLAASSLAFCCLIAPIFLFSCFFCCWGAKWLKSSFSGSEGWKNRTSSKTLHVFNNSNTYSNDNCCQYNESIGKAVLVIQSVLEYESFYHNYYYKEFTQNTTIILSTQRHHRVTHSQTVTILQGILHENILL